MYKEFAPGDFGNLRLPGDHIVRTRELRYEGEAIIRYFHVTPPPSLPGAEGPHELGTVELQIVLRGV